MKSIDVFNGDADGICALHQLRLADPKDSVLITGVKRDIALVQQVEANASDDVTILDISLDKNRDALLNVLNTGATVKYIDHHFPGDIPTHDNLTTHIDTAAETCTGLIVNGILKGQQLPWAVTAAFGDNLFKAAARAAEPLDLSDTQLAQLKTLGTLLNYNGYGSTLEDLYFPPAELYKRVQPHASPFTFIEEDDAFTTLANGFDSDHAKAVSIRAERSTDNTAIFIFPNDPFARRISGVYANELAQQNPNRAHALLSELEDGSYLVSVRAPLNNRTGADELCRQFETGGGRKAAAGINKLPSSELETFATAMSVQFG
ncbi:acetyltransferase [Granulosicoccus sp.]|nr:acetyltransferase [Granulosicoccus sp.]MDB4222743.1 acetyltransferase [Granulosicoccus sp.]